MDLVVEKIKRNIPVESIILCGSKALGKSLSKESDYDIIVAMRTFLVPFYIKRIKKIEKDLKNCGVNVSINPLPLLRIKFSKGNLFLYKVKLEGKTVYGKDLLNKINTNDLREMPPRRFFSYLFSGAKELIKNFDPRDNSSAIEDILYDSAKTIIYCAETLLMTEGLYFINKEEMIEHLEGELRKDFEVALNIINKKDVSIEPMYFWLRSKNHVISTFLEIMSKYYGIKGGVKKAVDAYLEKNEIGFFKNLEYLVLTTIAKRNASLRLLFSRKSVEKRMFESLLLLLLSIDYNGREVTIEKTYLDECIKNLGDFMSNSLNNLDKKDLWLYARNKILENWQYACSVIGV